MPDYSINKDISQTLEIKSDEDLMFGGADGIDSSHPSLVFGDLTAIINEQNKSKDSPSSRPLPQPRVELKSVVSFGNFNMIPIKENTAGR